jgi:ribosome-associated translation inhibitor RaiA
MAIEIRGVPVGRGLQARILTQLTAALAQLGQEPAAVRASFVDENGPKGGLALRCALTVRVPHRPIVRVEETAADPRTAFDGAFAKLERDLERHRDRQREAKRHPKKYYVARRMIAAGGMDTEAKRRQQRAVRRRA